MKPQNKPQVKDIGNIETSTILYIFRPYTYTLYFLSHAAQSLFHFPQNAFDFITVYCFIQIISMFFITQAAQRNYPAEKILQQ